ncbi:hypothetical protein VCSRO187_3627 [Vibrio cholerae]|nr:hypothetical protein VCSRO187_3627 [Vibrio cholerae]
MTFENSILVKASRSQVYQLYRDVENWKEWDQEVKASKISSEFQEGCSGFLTPSKGPTAKIKIVKVCQDVSFTVVSKLPFCCMCFEHELIDEGNLTRVIHRVLFSGKLRFLFGFLIGNQIKKGLPQTLQGLKNRVENNHV